MSKPLEPPICYSINVVMVQWYAKPLGRQAAGELAKTAQYRLEKQGKYGGSPFAGIMMQTVADWWLDTGSAAYPTRGMHYANTRRKMALYHLIVGQLLMSCKMQTALDYLDIGLRYADGLIAASDYFMLYNRHEELRHLPLTATRQAPHDLPVLLNESRVIRKLKRSHSYTLPTKTNKA